ncbi:MAG: hydantoinase/oxoprolinase family protein [Thermodesulfobacteriota bacterium]
MSMTRHEPSVLALDAGGTMTDTFLVDRGGGFEIGKALTTSENESIGVMNSFADALKHWGLTLEEGAGSLQATIYSGTAMINRVLTRQGEGPLGLIVTAGFEDMLRFERGIQVWLGLSYPDRLHSVSHYHNDPIIPRPYIKGVRERITVFGQELAPLYRDEARRAVIELLDLGVKTICVCFLFSFRNPSHELAVEEIAREVMKERGWEVPIFLSCKHNPVRGELPRVQTLVLEAYAASPSRKHILAIHQALKEKGARAPLRIMTCYGGSIPPTHEWMVSTLISGPIGGITGAKHLGLTLGLQNIVCSDVGGTSFDVGLITEGQYALDIEPAIARMKLALPSVVMDSIGAGTGMYVRLDKVIKRIELGPDSAGFRIGMSLNENTPTLNDCSLVLGYLNPEYFLGGEVKLDANKARHGLKEQVADPLGIPVEEVAWGVYELVNTQMRDHLYAMILGRGFSPEVYALMSYGGAGPLHVCDYIKGLNFERVYVPTWAPAFSAFGCACADYTFRYDQQLDFPLSPSLAEAEFLAAYLNATWAGLKAKVEEEMKKEGLDPTRMDFQTLVRMQYTGQLDDLEIPVPVFPIQKEDIPGLLKAFEETYTKVFPTAPKSPELGHLMTRAVAQGVLPTDKPVLRKYPLAEKDPQPASRKGRRSIYWQGRWHEADIFEMDLIEPGNVIHGPAVIEAPATTFLLPPGFETILNAYKIFEITQRA